MAVLPYLRLLLRLLTTVRNWPVYFLNRYGYIKKSEVRYKLWNGMTIESRPFRIDGSALNDVWLDRSYEPSHAGIDFDWHACKTIVDIGANIGTFTLYAAARSPHARITSVEPEPGNAAMFRRNIELNSLEDRVHLIQAGIAAKEGEATLHVAHKNSGGHSLFQYTADSHPVQVKLLTLQQVFDRRNIAHCDYLKLDCEGGEYDGLYGLRPETLRSIRFAAIECHLFSKDPAHTPRALKSFLESRGFTVVDAKKSVYFAYRR